MGTAGALAAADAKEIPGGSIAGARRLFKDQKGLWIYAVLPPAELEREIENRIEKRAQKKYQRAKADLKFSEALRIVEEILKEEKTTVDFLAHLYGNLVLIRLAAGDALIRAAEPEITQARTASKDLMRKICARLDLPATYWNYPDKDNAILTDEVADFRDGNIEKEHIRIAIEVLLPRDVVEAAWPALERAIDESPDA